MLFRSQFNRGLGKDDLARLVAQYNQQFAGKLTAGGQIAPRLTLPANYSFNDSFFTQDLRLSRSFRLHGEHLQLVLLGEVFNLLNRPNFATPDRVVFAAAAANEAPLTTAGRITRTVTSSRQIQFGAKILF